MSSLGIFTVAFSLVCIGTCGAIWKLKSGKPMGLTRGSKISTNWVTNSAYFAAEDSLGHPDLDRIQETQQSKNDHTPDLEYKLPPAGVN